MKSVRILLPEGCRIKTQEAFEVNCEFYRESVFGSEFWKKTICRLQEKYVFVVTKTCAIDFVPGALNRFINVAEATSCTMLYADYRVQRGEHVACVPTIDYQLGSVRDDFDFGSVLLFDVEALQRAVCGMSATYSAAALYDVRLRLSLEKLPLRINEFLYTEITIETQSDNHFAYVDPKNRASQIEMEHAFTLFLKQYGAYLQPDFKQIDLSAGDFCTEATILIPVRNREQTIEDAIRSVLKQKTTFPFNLIVVDNHSTDATSAIVARCAEQDARVKHLMPERTDLGIGGCWHYGVNHADCGRFVVQLDSDDVYVDEFTLQKVVDTFRREQCAMVIGSYTITDFEMNPIPPGLIDHREWTEENGRNNALRINGLGAPRAFFTPVLRSLGVPNTSYGEDYALGLQISRCYKIGRIFDSIYLCRRWHDNTDASLSVEKSNANNSYKDKLRSIELLARKQQNLKK